MFNPDPIQNDELVRVTECYENSALKIYTVSSLYVGAHLLLLKIFADQTDLVLSEYVETSPAPTLQITISIDFSELTKLLLLIKR